jgi:photosystem II stability/assembly factor-like uncharacterized protein
MRFLLFALMLCLSLPSFAQKAKKNKKAKEETAEVEKQKMPSWGALKFRSVGPATHSGRIADFAVNPKNPAQYYVAVASGGIWKTDNAGTTYYPIFDSYSSYSVGCLRMDPNNENVIWAGTGENNNQRSVAYGDGVYKSMDGGKSWKNMGLKESEHIGMIQVDPRNSNVVYVAAYGPLWSAGGERGLYKTTDGGENWERILEIDEHTGVSEVHLDPRNPDLIYAVSHQRRRHVFTYLGGGPGSGIHKSTDGGKTWKRLKGGLPQGDYVGRIGLDISPADPDYVYAIVEATGGKKGFYRSTDRGESWEKRSSYATSGNYYQEIICDLYDKDKVFSMNTWLHHTEDGGKTFKMTGEKSKHVDNHCIWIDPNNTNHWLVGCDGGIYETWDHAQNWHYKSNLPLTQYYKVAVDNSEPFYYIYGGTQDNNSMGGPSRTTNAAGIVNSDWFITNGGDGFESQVDPKDPNIIYAQAQYGWLVRYDKKSGQRVGIKPLEAKDEPALRWNWDAPLLISPHNHKRLYFCANKIYRSDNRGDDWILVSPDLTRQLDRNKMEVMGRVWSMDAVMKSKSTTIFGNIVAFDESPKKEGLLYAGTDDGLIQVSEDAGGNWRKIEKVGEVPEMTYVNALVTSMHDENTVYAVFNNHKRGDFKPYIYKSIDKGQTWTAVHGDLPERGTVYDIAEDHVDPNLLFAGTEFGVFFSNNGGKNWHQLKAGLPTIAVKDIEIQRRENDLVLATFGRSFYVLDDYTPLRHFKEEDLNKELVVYPIKDAWMFIESRPLGLGGKANQGESFYTADNPPVAATFSYLFNDTTFMSIKDARQKLEKDLIKADKEVPFPSLQELHDEDWENAPYVIATITNSRGEVVRRLKTKPGQGLNRLTWDFRYESLVPVELQEREPGRYGSRTSGALAAPGKYAVQFHKVMQGKVTALSGKTEFTIKSLDNATLGAEDLAAVNAFEVKFSKMRRAARGLGKVYGNMNDRIKHLKKAVLQTPESDLNTIEWLENLEVQLKELGIVLYGDASLSSREFETKTSLSGRIEITMGNIWGSTAKVPEWAEAHYQEAGEILEDALKTAADLEKEIAKIEEQLYKQGAPYSKGSSFIPDWKLEGE